MRRILEKRVIKKIVTQLSMALYFKIINAFSYVSDSNNKIIHDVCEQFSDMDEKVLSKAGNSVFLMKNNENCVFDTDILNRKKCAFSIFIDLTSIENVLSFGENMLE